MKKFISFLVALFCMCAVFSWGGCKKIANDENTLEIYITNAGYGTEWLNAQIELFQQQNWVKEKYPDLVIPEPQSNSTNTYPFTRIVAGEKANSTDLFFATASPGSYYRQNTNFEDLSDVYESTVPGESISVKKKMYPAIYEYQEVEILNSNETAYYGIPWVNGTMGLFYNKTKLENITEGHPNIYDGVLPRTTEELKKLVADIKPLLSEGDAPFIFTASANYWKNLFVIWWAQYEGLDNYVNYWEGLAEEDGVLTYSNKIFEQTGRLRSLEVIESLINYPLGNNHSTCVGGLDHIQVQADFVLGTGGVFMPVGDWVENEMNSYESDQVIGFMKTPVISSITEVCDSVNEEEELAFVVQCIDEKKDFSQTSALFETEFSGRLTETDFNKISDARNMFYVNEGHAAYIPSYATAKEVAKDFLRFLATDVSLELYAETGFLSPYQYNVQDKQPEVYEGYTQMAKDRNEYYQTAVLMPPRSSFRLCYYGGLSELPRNAALDVKFAYSDPADRKSAQQIYDDDRLYYDKGRFDTLLMQAGLI